jgi:hypothetical protein
VLGLVPHQDEPRGLRIRSFRGTLKELVTNEIKKRDIVYERRFPKSLPQQQRESYFFTELFNIKRLLRRQSMLEAESNLRLHSSTGKDEDSGAGLASYYTPTGLDDHTLVFESRFECGNLSLAVKVLKGKCNKK